MVDGLELLALSLGIVLDHDLERAQHRHATLGDAIEHLAHRELEHADIDYAVGLGDADPLDEVADRLPWYAAPAQPRDRGHAGGVPAFDMAAANELGEHALRQHGVSEGRSVPHVLPRPRHHLDVLEEPVVQRAVIPALARADRMRDVLDRVRL